MSATMMKRIEWDEPHDDAASPPATEVDRTSAPPEEEEEAIVVLRTASGIIVLKSLHANDYLVAFRRH